MGALPAVRDATRLRGLPLCDPADVEQAGGFVRFARGAVGIPLTAFGLLATATAVLMGSVAATAAAAATTALIVASIVGDTRLSRALERLRRGDVQGARDGMQHVARSRGPGRQRAESYLAMIAWSRGDHAEALRWTRARSASLRSGRGPQDERFLTRASEAMLGALLGEGRADAEVCRELGEPPPGARYAEAWAAARLAHAFVNDDIDPVRTALPQWADLLDDGRAEHATLDAAALSPLVGAQLAWALARAGRDERARAVLERCVVDRLEHVALHSRQLADWCTRFEHRPLQYRNGF